MELPAPEVELVDPTMAMGSIRIGSPTGMREGDEIQLYWDGQPLGDALTLIADIAPDGTIDLDIESGSIIGGGTVIPIHYTITSDETVYESAPFMLEVDR
ncbi:hypothetical protein [Embleya sp. AB8]|uniref:hypothetical protein n=1 Tax=Embleya sp. AB8 TaxID=3156304 RepID=UPI003C747A54